MSRTRDDTIKQVTDDYLNSVAGTYPPPSPSVTKSWLLDTAKAEFDLENAMRSKGDKWKIPQVLSASQIASIILRLYPVRNIICADENTDPEYDLLAMYQDEGPDAGIYVSSEREFHSLIKLYNYNIGRRESEEVLWKLKQEAPRVHRTEDRDLIAVNNGIFNYRTKQLLPFSPDYVFIAKSRVDYNPNAVNVNIHNDEDGTDWDVESWMLDLFDGDVPMAEVIWEMLGAIIRPNVPWDRSAWLYSESGNNGKGTLCELMRQLCGDGSYACIPLSDMGKEFLLEPLTRSTAIIVDENDVGAYIDKAANLKSIITNDVIQINRKFKVPIPYKFHGFMVQCLNEFPRFKDKSDSFYRRQLFVPFMKCFTGHERKYIKHDYLRRREVLEYVLKRVLHMDYYELSTPQACTEALNEYREFNDPVRQFAEEILPTCVWDLLPFTFLYDLYRAWFAKNMPSGSMQSRNTFINDILNAIKDNPDWKCDDRKRAIRTGDRMAAPEKIIEVYDLREWMNDMYISSRDWMRRCTVTPATSYRGILRTVPLHNKFMEPPRYADPSVFDGSEPDGPEDNCAA